MRTSCMHGVSVDGRDEAFLLDCGGQVLFVETARLWLD